MSSTYEETKTELELMLPSHAIRKARSPIFGLIMNIMANPADLLFADLQATTPMLIAKDSAYLLNIPDTIEHHPVLATDSYVFKERHFRIDKIFKNSTRVHHGLTAIHYTERYSLLSALEDDTQDIVIHVYFLKTGLFFYIDCPIPLSDTQRDCLKANAERFKKIIMDLIDENNKRYLKQKAIVKNVNTRLNDLSRSLNTIDQVEAYIKHAKIFIQEIRNLNQYTESDDPREIITQKTIDALEKRISHYKSIASKRKIVQCDNVEEDKKEICESSSSTDLNDPIEYFTQETLEMLSKNLEDIGSLAKKYKVMRLRDPNIDDIVADYPLIEAITQYQLLLLSLPAGIKKENQDIINKLSKDIEAEIQIFDTFILNCLAMSARDGNPLIFESLFILFENRLTESFYIELIEALINCSPGMKKNNIMNVCEFLHTYSPLYKQVVLNMSNESSYETSKVEFKGISDYDQVESPSFFDDILISLLFKVYLKSDVDTFNMFLKQGANANTWGIKNKDIHLKNKFSLIYSIGAYSNDDYHYYIQALIAYDANPNLKSHQSNIIQGHAQLQRSLIDKKIKKLSKGMISAKLTDTHDMSELLILAIKSYDTKVVNCLIPHTNIRILTLALCELFNQNLFNNRCNPSNTPFVKYAYDIEMANQLSPIKTNPTAQPFIAYLIYPIVTLSAEKKEEVKIFSEYFKSLHLCLMEKLRNPQITQTEFDQTYNELFDKGINYQQERNHLEAYRLFQACDFLITLKAALLPNLKEQISFMKCYIPTLGPRLVSTCTLSYQEYNINSDIPRRLQLRNQTYAQNTRSLILSHNLGQEEKKLEPQTKTKMKKC